MPEPDSRWWQVNLSCETWQAAEQMAARHLGPLLIDAEHNGDITAWWFIRKGESWRLRVLPAGDRDAEPFLAQLTQTLTGRAVIHHAEGVIYEPETRRFGGPEAMHVAHSLFHADSPHILHHLAGTQGEGDLRRELGVRLATRMMLAAGQDFYEQGDIWTQVAEHRGSQGHIEPSPGTLAAVQTLITAKSDNRDSPLALAPGWPAAFETAGAAIADLARCGRLTRGLRAVLTDHLLFAFNRHGISAPHQSALATAASRVIFHREPIPSPLPQSGHNDPVHPTTVRPVTMHSTDAPALDPHELVEALIARIDRLGNFRTPHVKDAFRAVPRHVFLPGVDLATAYAPKPVVTKRAEDGSAISSASSPSMVATMLEQLDVRRGQRVLEIGAATGINAALLAELVGPTGSVVTIELDDDLAAGARTGLAAAGYHQVEVICGDGALGDPSGKTFDRIIVTAGAWDISAAWWQQLAIGGRLVVPLRLHGSGLTRSLAFDRTENDRMLSTNAEVCGFVPMRGASEMGERHVRLADEVILKIDADDLPDEVALAKALTHPAHQQWTGIEVRHDEPAAHLDLWLATINSGLRFSRLSASASARALGLADPAMRWAGAGLYDEGTIVYIAARPVSDEANELGLIAHGPDSSKLVGQVNDLLHRWSQDRPAQPNVNAYPATTPEDQIAPGARIARPDTRLTIDW
ncbi:methyltransferase, FxLD system [Streptomyces sp. SID13588]|uniref:methyltransferase, FxLD system n=1 Tax=Streptomyces sp. SID13588 TaxID=2706051 RepID=UPI0013CDC66E|nr:methyltransferase, FxLD system [Streptomyces sp. SID13588]NEA72737.1 methyltransferase, FxLD system [Streptomyces sp. SID13588]